jgi:hypothetical protein
VDGVMSKVVVLENNGAQADGVMGKVAVLENIVIGNNGVIDANTAQVDGVMSKVVVLENNGAQADGVMGKVAVLENIATGNGATVTVNGNVSAHTITIQHGSTLTIDQGSITGPLDLIFGNNTMHIEEGAVLTHCTIEMVGDALNITQLNDGQI